MEEPVFDKEFYVFFNFLHGPVGERHSIPLKSSRAQE